MKKAPALLVLLLLLTGCSNQQNTSVSSVQEIFQQTREMQIAAETAEPTEEAYTIPEEAELPFRNKPSYKVYKKQTYSSGTSFLTVETYDEHDNVILKEDIDETGEVIYKKETAYEYDEEGNAVKRYYSGDSYDVMEYENGKEIRWFYYYKGELNSENTYGYYPNGDFKCIWSSHFGGEPYSWMIYEYEYDEQGRIIVTREKTDEDELKYTKYITYDDSGNAVESVEYKELSYYDYLDASREVERYKRTYDADGNILSYIRIMESRDGVVAYESSCEYKYDEQGRVVSMEEHYGNGESMITEYTYEMIESEE